MKIETLEEQAQRIKEEAHREEEGFDNYEKQVDMEERKQGHLEENIKVCERCGGETETKYVGDESYEYCASCLWCNPK